VNATTFSKLTSSIYEAAVTPGRWPDALHEIQVAFRSNAVSLITRDMTTMKGRWISTHHADTEREFWGKSGCNPFAIAAVRPRPQPVETDQDILPKGELLRTEYYNDFWQRHDIHANLQLWLERRGPIQPSLSVARSRSAGEFAKPDVELAQLLLPHIQRAVTVEQRLHYTDLAKDAAADALDTLRHGVMILDGTGRVIYLNRLARRLVAEGDGLSLDNNRLRGATPTLTRRLDAMLAKVAGRTDDFPIADATSLSRPSGKAPLALVAVPLRGEVEWLRTHGSMICLCVTDPTTRPATLPRVLARSFGLTATETAIAESLTAGSDIREIADQRKITPGTVRLHLSRIMAKTQTRRQAELVRLLMSIAPVCIDQR
jgi:DNA-binding CsgD family transcriptional regulator